MERRERERKKRERKKGGGQREEWGSKRTLERKMFVECCSINKNSRMRFVSINCSANVNLPAVVVDFVLVQPKVNTQLNG